MKKMMKKMEKMDSKLHKAKKKVHKMEKEKNKKEHHKKKEKKGEKKVEKVMREFKHGELHSGSKKGPRVSSRKQAVAIALSEARKKGAKIPKRK
jgi:hypothetical protein